MTRRTPISTRTDTLVPVTTLFRSPGIARDLPEPDAASRGRRLVHAAALAADAAKPSLARALLLSRTRQHDGTPRHRLGYGIRPRFGAGGFPAHDATAKGPRAARHPPLLLWAGADTSSPLLGSHCVRSRRLPSDIGGRLIRAKQCRSEKERICIGK